MLHIIIKVFSASQNYLETAAKLYQRATEIMDSSACNEKARSRHSSSLETGTTKLFRGPKEPP